jgi:hypothetical protein
MLFRRSLSIIHSTTVNRIVTTKFIVLMPTFPDARFNIKGPSSLSPPTPSHRLERIGIPIHIRLIVESRFFS